MKYPRALTWDAYCQLVDVVGNFGDSDMDNLIERLRVHHDSEYSQKVCEEAAARIEELERENAAKQWHIDRNEEEIKYLQARIEELEEREQVLLHNMNAIHQNITWIARLSEPVHPPQEDMTDE